MSRTRRSHLSFSKISKELWLFALAALIFIIPAFYFGSGGYDLVFHTLWSQHFSEQFWNGDIYPRWMMNLNAGCGSPVFFFYSPLPYYLTSLFYFMDDWGPNSGWLPMAAATFVVSVFAGYGFYLWTREFLHKHAALLGGVLYVLLPYTWIAFYVRLAFTEFFVLLWLPLLLRATRRICLGENGNADVPAFALLYALLIVSNIPGAIIVTYLLVFYAFFLLPSGQWLRRGIRIDLAAVLGLGLAAIYLLPLISQLPYTQVGGEHLSQGGVGLFDYTANFINNLDNYFEMVALAVMIPALLISCYYLRRKSSKQKLPKEIYFWFWVGVASFFMMLPWSQIVWEMSVFLPHVRFPMRFMLLLSLAIAVMLAALIHFFLQKKLRRVQLHWNCAAGVICVLLPLGAFFAESTRVQLEGAPINENHGYQQKYYRLNSSIFFEHEPAQVDVSWFLKSGIQKLAKECSKRVEGLGHADIEFEVMCWRPGDLLLRIKNPLDVAVPVAIGQFYFPGWRAFDQTDGVALLIAPEKGLGRMVLRVLPGTHEIRVHFPMISAEKWGWAISFLSFVLLIFLFRKYRVNNTR